MLTFKEGLEVLVQQTIEAEKHLPEGVSVSKNVFEYDDVLGYQIMITVGKDILEDYEDDEDDFSSEDWDDILSDEEGLFGDDYDDYDDYDD